MEILGISYIFELIYFDDGLTLLSNETIGSEKLVSNLAVDLTGFL